MTGGRRLIQLATKKRQQREQCLGRRPHPFTAEAAEAMNRRRERLIQP